jgi:peroxiredoxin
MPFLPGDPVPSFAAECTSNPRFHFDTVAGRYVVLSLFGSAGGMTGRRMLDDLLASAHLYDDAKLSFFGVSTDPADRTLLEPRVPGIRYFWDGDRAVSRLFGALPAEGDEYRPFTLILDPMLRVVAWLPGGDPRHGELARSYLAGLPPVDAHAGVRINAPVLVAPRIFEPGFCRQLIDEYERLGGEDSGFLREERGVTVGLIDHRHKRRFDCPIGDETLRKGAAGRIARRLFPLVGKSFAFAPTRMERYIVACYDTQSGGYFRPHRDNTTSGTAHRRFAVTINLNAGDYEGGDLRFPEFGTATYRAPTGGAVVFSCSLLHEALPVTRGRRFAFLPFLYDDEAACIRAHNNEKLGEGVSRYEGAGS